MLCVDQVELSATGRSFVQRCVTERDLETSARGHRLTRAGQEPARLSASCVVLLSLCLQVFVAHMVWLARIGGKL